MITLPLAVRRGASYVALVALVLSSLGLVASTPAAAQTNEVTFTSNGTFVVPTGVEEVTFEVVGGRGGRGGGDFWGSGGIAARVIASTEVTTGTSYTITVGRMGGQGSGSAPGAGGAGFGNGGRGGGGSLAATDGGGGGGASRVSLGADPLVVAGGGGGGGGGSVDAGGPGRDADSNTNVYLGGGNGAIGNGAGNSTTSGGGGGGGGGFRGGEGGVGPGCCFLGGGGGSGGESFVAFGVELLDQDLAWTAEDGFVRVTYEQTFPTTVAVSPTHPTAVVGEPVQFSVVATGDDGSGDDSPAGLIEIRGPSNELLADGRSSPTGPTSFWIHDLPVGPTDLTAHFSPDNPVLNSSAQPFQVTVEQGESAVVLASDVPSTSIGQAVTFTAAAMPVPPAVATPTGSIQFLVDGDEVGAAVPVDQNGQASMTMDDLPLGHSTIGASYEGDVNLLPSPETSVTHTVVPGDVSVHVSSAVNPSAVGESVSVSAQVLALEEDVPVTPSGEVQFEVDGELVGEPVPLNPQGSTLTVLEDLPLGSNRITAHYSGDQNFNEALSAPLDQVVNPGDTEIDISSSVSSTPVGETVEFRAEVGPAGPAQGDPTGTVTFEIGMARSAGNLRTTVPLGAEQTAILPTSELPVGINEISVHYNGDSDFRSSSSRPISHVVTAGDVGVDLAASSDESSAGEPVTFAAELTALDPAKGTPRGEVAFYVNGAPLSGPVPLTPDGTAAVTTAELPEGNHAVNVRYLGDKNFQPTSGPTVLHLVSDESIEGQDGPTSATSSPDSDPRQPTMGPGGSGLPFGGALPLTGSPTAFLLTLAALLIAGGGALVRGRLSLGSVLSRGRSRGPVDD